MIETLPQTRKPNTVIKDLVVDPDVAKALVEGVPVEEIAKQLGVSQATIRNWMGRMEFKDLLKIEARRAIKGMRRKSLKNVPYHRLAWATTQLLDKIDRIENNGLQNQPGEIHNTLIQNIKIGLFGRSESEGSEADSSEATDLPAEDIRCLPEEAESNGEEKS
jgi:hypothetical protein